MIKQGEGTMLEQSLERLERELAAVRRELASLRGFRAAVLPPREAAKRLSIGLTKMRELMARGAPLGVQTTLVGGRKMVPASEIERLSTPLVRLARAPHGYERKQSPREEAAELRAALKRRRKR